MSVDPEYAQLLSRVFDAEANGRPTGELVDQLHARYATLLGGNTPAGLPYPAPTDAIAQGADAIRALAEALDPRVSDTGWVPITTLGGGVSVPAGAGYQPRVRKIGKHVTLSGLIVVGAGWSAGNLLTIPTGFRLASTYPSLFFGTAVTNAGHSVELFLGAADNRVQIPTGYASASINNGEAIPLAGSWYVD